MTELLDFVDAVIVPALIARLLLDSDVASESDDDDEDPPAAPQLAAAA